MPRTLPPMIPAQTRLLLQSDGSTTLLLESLVDLRVAVEVESQSPVSADELSPSVRAGLGLARTDVVVRRNSVLRTPCGRTVSRNLVVFRPEAAPWLAGAADPTPLGYQLRNQQALQHRELIDHGVSVWADDGPPCAFKEYVIHRSAGARIYVHERFNPVFVPVGPGPSTEKES